MHSDSTDAIKRIPILDVAERLGIEVHGRKAMCFNNHDSRTRSLTFSTEKNNWKCFGACGKGGDGIALVMEKLGVSFRVALNWFSDHFGVERPHGAAIRRPVKQRSSRKAVGEPRSEKPACIAGKEEYFPDPDIYEWLVGKCGTVSDPIGLQYLESHGIPSHVAHHFGIRELRDSRRAFREMIAAWGGTRVLQSGIAWGDRGFAERLIWNTYALLFPVHTVGRIAYLQGRLFTNGPKYLGLRKVAKPLFNTDSLERLPAGTVVHICEGIPDAIALEGCNLHAVGVLGATSFRKEWVDSLMPFDLALIPDADAGGNTFRRTVTDSFRARGKPVTVVKLPFGRDTAEAIARLRGAK